ncbi:MAG: DUF1289 domain-containing protein [Pseudomonadota bacterium]
MNDAKGAGGANDGTTGTARQESVPSPCVAICALDDNDICIGCCRSGREISDWGKLSDDEKRAVLRRCAQRASTV